MEPLYAFHCKDCELPMKLRAETLGYMFGLPEQRRIVASSVALVCPRCKKVGNYSLLQSSPAYNPQDQGTWECHEQDAELLDWLECGEENCKSPLPLFAVWSPTTSAEGRRADTSTWRWENLHCPDGHGIEAPLK